LNLRRQRERAAALGIWKKVPRMTSTDKRTARESAEERERRETGRRYNGEAEERKEIERE